MIKSFLFEGVEAAWHIDGVRNAVERRVPERGHKGYVVEPMTVDGRRMKRGLSCVVRIYAPISTPDHFGKNAPYAYVVGDSATARDLYNSLKNSGFECDWIH